MKEWCSLLQYFAFPKKGFVTEMPEQPEWETLHLYRDV